MASIFAHSTLGDLVPLSGDGVNQFLGLKYASLANRFSPPTLYKDNNKCVLDATQYGPSVVSAPTGCDIEFGFIQQSLLKSPFKSSGLDGLNLNVTVPADAAAQQRLPVVVFIHGGGFAIGGNAWPQYDFAKLVKLSSELNQPIIGVNINYRLGVFGFLTSEEMRAAGYLGNNGLRDQRVAFEWIKEHIAGFGGDPDNITVMGESAGGVSTTLHFYSNAPLFTRAVSLGGTSLLMKPLPQVVHEVNYKTVLESLGITATSPMERIKAILDTSSDEILFKIPPGLPLFPVFDGDIVPSMTLFKDVADPVSTTLPAKVWLKSLFVGNNKLDASIFIEAMESQGGDLVINFITSITKSLCSYPGVSEQIFGLYGISPSLSKEDGVRAVLEFATDIGFVLPSYSFAEGFIGKSNLYAFNEPNPWEGRFKGSSSHILDVAFLFQNYNHLLSSAQVNSARGFASDVISFANGKLPWRKFDNVNREIRMYGSFNGDVPDVEGTAIAASGTGTSRRLLDLFKFKHSPGFDCISHAFGTFLAGQ